MLQQFPVKAETTENLSVGAPCFAPDLGREQRGCFRQGCGKRRILNQHYLATGRVSILRPLSRRSASWISMVDFERSGFNWQVDL